MSGAFDPVHAAHAIERVSAAIVFNSPITGNEWLAVSRALASCAGKLELEKYEDVTGFTPQISAQGGQLPTFSVGLMTGARFVRESMNGDELVSVNASRTGVQLESRQYIRWAGFEEMLKEVVESVVGAFPEHALISQVRLDYLDRFIERQSGRPHASWREVLQEGDHISPDHLDRETAWHTHVGWFEDHKDTGRLLLNLNVDVFAEPVEDDPTPRSISIYSLVSSITPGSVARDSRDILKRFDALHTRSKVVVRSVLTPGMQSRISIDVDEKSA